ncbi:rhodanese-like domain-containing protein [Methylovulum psychrotolerans]|uniref:rhodanese-like domain-containing protein n=1 Tax=Methylovulum psychrotolerans TaxID=1704499 RepID=UPI001BFFB2C3|nr:rhodanese-like domain-containing protein [Methylovulum psychrotolerans]MBT9096121.1 rhodanese-like domain-containing protein [Methylovulum psychrotolerans]
MRNLVKYCGSGVFAALLWALTSVAVQAGTGVAVVVSPQQAATLRSNQKAIIIDVREESEWQEQHIPGALHIPLGQLASRLGELDAYKHKPIIMQCRSGKRSAAAQASLKAAGFTEVYNMEGGLMAWQAQGLATE